MGHGIAQVSAQAGYKVVAVEMADAALQAGMKRIDGSLQKVIGKEVAAGKITEVSAQLHLYKQNGQIFNELVTFVGIVGTGRGK
jgi:3-hydroxyacyl-CoA dehydrogenase